MDTYKQVQCQIVQQLKTRRKKRNRETLFDSSSASSLAHDNDDGHSQDDDRAWEAVDEGDGTAVYHYATFEDCDGDEWIWDRNTSEKECNEEGEDEEDGEEEQLCNDVFDIDIVEKQIKDLVDSLL